MLAFSGSRSLSPLVCEAALLVLRAAAASGKWSSLCVGCCPSGLDAAVSSSPVFRSHAHRVFRAASRHSSDLVKRSVHMVEAAAGIPGSGLVAYPGRACPGRVRPSRSAVACFCGGGSGTWASAALAAGRGLPVWVGGLSGSQLPSSWGSWVRSCRFPGCWRLVPSSPTQLSLF